MEKLAHSSVSTIRGVEDLCNSRYYTVQRRLLSIIGEWPYQNTNVKRVFRFATIIGFISMYYIEIAALVVFYNNPAEVLELLPHFIAGLAGSVKVCTLIICSMEVKQLSDHMLLDWQTHVAEKEICILRKYAEQGRLFTILYTCMIKVLNYCEIIVCCSAIAYAQTPLLPKILDIFYPLNESRPNLYMFPAEYIFIDKEKHFTLIYFHSAFIVFLTAVSIVASDSLFLMYVQHVCTMFAITAHRFKTLSIRNSRSRTPCTLNQNELFLHDIIRSIHSHEQAIELAKVTESLYSTPLLIHLALDSICLSVTLYQTSMLIAERRMGVALRNISFIIGQLFHVFCASYPGQRLIDHSADVKIQAVSGRWYEGPAHMQKMLMVVMRRSLEPCSLTAGKVFTFSLESFTSLVQSAMSFFMVLQSTK